MSVDLSALTALSPLDGRYRSNLTELSQLFSEFSLIKHRLLIEVEYLLFLVEQQLVAPLTDKQQLQLRQVVTHFSETDALAIKEIEVTTKHDVKAIEYWLSQKMTKLGLPLASVVHVGLTSEDVNSLSYSLILHQAQASILLPSLRLLLQHLSDMATNYAHVPMLALTHGQPAVPTTVGKEVANVAMRLLTELQLIEACQIEGKINGAVGNYNVHIVALNHQGHDWLDLSQVFIKRLGLKPQLFTTQILPAESYTRFFSGLVRINQILLDLNQDIWLYISRGILTQKKAPGQVGSSTMPHKINPIDFENSEGNLGLANALLQHFIVKLPVSRLQRDLSDSTVKRSMGTAVGHCLLAYTSLRKGLQKISVNKDFAEQELNTHWEVLTEAVQVALRLAGDTHGYQKLQHLSQGLVIDQPILHEFIAASLLAPDLKKQLLRLTPSTYLGLAPTLTKQATKYITTYLKGAS